MLPTTRHRQARLAPWRRTWTPCPTRAWSLVAFGETSSHVKGLLLGMAARAQQVGRVYRGGKCIPQEIALLYRFLVHRVTVHAGKAFSRFLLTRLRFAHPNRDAPRCKERVLRNVNDIVGYDAPRTPYADISNSPLLRRAGS